MHLPARAIEKEMRRLLGPPGKPNRRARKYGVSWEIVGGEEDAAIVLTELVPVIIRDTPQTMLVDYAQIPITSVEDDYSVFDILHQNLRGAQGEESMPLVEQHWEQEEREAAYAKQQIDDEFWEEYDRKDRGVQHFGPWKNRG